MRTNYFEPVKFYSWFVIPKLRLLFTTRGLSCPLLLKNLGQDFVVGSRIRKWEKSDGTGMMTTGEQKKLHLNVWQSSEKSR